MSNMIMIIYIDVKYKSKWNIKNGKVNDCFKTFVKYFFTTFILNIKCFQIHVNWEIKKDNSNYQVMQFYLKYVIIWNYTVI